MDISIFFQQLKRPWTWPWKSWQFTPKPTKFCKEYKRTSRKWNIPFAENTPETQMNDWKH